MASRPRVYPKRVVILGGGFGGVRTALRLNRALPAEYSIVLVDKRAYHLPHWQLYETATMHMLRERERDFRAIEGFAGIPFADIFRGTRVSFVQATVKDVFLSDHSVALSFPSNDDRADPLHTGLLHFSHIVLALGAETNYFEVAGLRERSYGLKTLGEALNLRNSLEELFSQKKKGERIDITIAGGGFTGVELAAELPGYLRKLAGRYGIRYEDVHITLVEGGSCLLPGARAWLVEKAEDRLRSLGVTMLLETPIVGYKDGKVLMKGAGSLATDLLVWTAGIRANALLERITGAELSKTCMVVNDHLELSLYSYAYGIGDNVFCFDPDKKCQVPATAQRALEQADVAAHNIVASIRGIAPRPYAPREPAFIVPVGGRYALADIYGIRLEGLLAWLLKMAIGFQYLFSIIPFYKAIAIGWKSAVAYTANDR